MLGRVAEYTISRNTVGQISFRPGWVQELRRCEKVNSVVLSETGASGGAFIVVGGFNADGRGAVESLSIQPKA